VLLVLVINTVKVAKCVWLAEKIKFNSGRMRVITKSSLCNIEVALIGVLNKLRGFSASVYSFEPRSGVYGYFYNRKGDGGLGRSRICQPVQPMKLESNLTVAPSALSRV
jgi:hypothetical protein